MNRVSFIQAILGFCYNASEEQPGPAVSSKSRLHTPPLGTKLSERNDYNMGIYEDAEWGTKHGKFLFDNIRNSGKIEKDKTIVLTAFLVPGAKKPNESEIALLELLYSCFSKEKICKIVERNHLDGVLRENSLQLVDFFDGKKISNIGNLVGADVIVVGRITQNPEHFTVNWRLVSLTTGEIITGDGVDYPKVKNKRKT